MGPREAITTGFRKGFQFSGRASRAEFWWFAPFALALPLAAALLLSPATDVPTLLVKLTVIGLLSVPFFATAYRRYQDTGLPGQDLWLVLRPTLIVLATGYFLLLALTGMASIVFALPGFVIGLIAVPMFAVNLFLAPGTFGTAIGQLLIPSDASENSFGPNPNEVPS